eukprot:jgi/Tetstr1/445058/TSEL_032863.t1
MAFFQEYRFEWVIIVVAGIGVAITGLAIALAAAERRQHLEKRQREVEDQAIADAAIDRSDKLRRQAHSQKVDSGGGEIAGAAGGYGALAGAANPPLIHADELADPPVCLGCAADLAGGRALLMTVGMQKVMPRPTGGLLSRMSRVDEVHKIQAPGSDAPVFLLYPGAEYHSLELSITAPVPTSFLLTGVRTISVQLLDEAPLTLPVKVDSCTSQQLDVSAVWDTIPLVEAIQERGQAVDVVVGISFKGLPSSTPVYFNIKVKLVGAEQLVPDEDALYRIPEGFQSQVPLWAKPGLSGQPVVLKLNMKQEV